MKILVIGGTRYFGIHMVNILTAHGHDVTVATRGLTPDNFGNKVKRVIFDRYNADSIINKLSEQYYDVVIDKIAYCSNDVRLLLDNIQCGRYILMSSTAVYPRKTLSTSENDYNYAEHKLVWCNRADFSYDEVKRQAENALYWNYPHIKWTAVRCPVVLGRDDYTERLLFYVRHIMQKKPMNIDNLDNKMSFIDSREAGDFLAFVAENNNIVGSVNGSSHGAISLKEIIDFIEEKTNKKAVISQNGDSAPFNSECEFGINTQKAESFGYKFSNVNDWIFKLLEHYIMKFSC